MSSALTEQHSSRKRLKCESADFSPSLDAPSFLPLLDKQTYPLSSHCAFLPLRDKQTLQLCLPSPSLDAPSFTA